MNETPLYSILEVLGVFIFASEEKKVATKA